MGTMMRYAAAALLAAVATPSVATYYTATLGAEVTTVPGLTEPYPYKHYSGYLTAGEGRQLHYWFFESHQSPSSDPVLLWMNGGPGCSSLVATVGELGPFRVGDLGLNMTLNPDTWVANVLFLEAPAGVGYSYDPTGVYVTDDTQTADDNYLAVQDFFEKYPEYKKNDFYIAGESYAGVYVPTLASRVLKNPNGVQFKGIAIGNGAVDFPILGNSLIFFGNYHGLFGQRLWNVLTQHCCHGSQLAQDCDFGWNITDVKCNEAVDEANNIVLHGGLNVYNLYDPCSYEDEPGPVAFAPPKKRSMSQHKAQKLIMKSLNRVSSPNRVNSPDLMNIDNPNCVSEERLQLYFNRNDVKEALHVQETPAKWEPCSTKLNYTEQYLTVRDVVRELVDSGRLRTLFYNGDVDMACNFLGGEWFVQSLGYRSTSEYKTWKAGLVIGGFFETFEKNVTFVTVKGAGHMVPLDKAPESLRMITNFLTNTPF
ncbi:hypothetical protein HPB47_005580 [Ixodes persulcatus]|uniref:Uncharacterized protein n=1 Tax=Ixodes persulcatus TaxID=34615 RepID=A0AC60PCK6_IXOPE|nr:hypothetical protein HPB47_005580 [Ixodes persulcatus]